MSEHEHDYIVEVTVVRGSRSALQYLSKDEGVDEEGEEFLADDRYTSHQRQARRMTRAEAHEEAKAEVEGGAKARVLRLKPGPKARALQQLLTSGKAWIADGCYGLGGTRDDLVRALKTIIEAHGW